jgi:hypothetical protein
MRPAERRNLLYFDGARRNLRAPDMDKFWSIFTMPIGLLLCFGPAFFVWFLTERKRASSDEPKRRE